MSNIIYHIHHIVPKHMGGTDEPSNLIRLTVEEHAIAHKKLWEQYGRWQDELAYKGLSGILTCDETKLDAGRLANLGNKNALGKKWSEESKSKMKGNKNGLGHKYVCSEETKEKIRIARSKQVTLKGYKHSEETKKRISETISKKQLGVKRGPYKKKIKL